MMRHDEASPRQPLTLDADAEHSLRNHLAIILGFCEVMLRELPPGGTIRGDLDEIRRAATAALALLAGTPGRLDD